MIKISDDLICIDVNDKKTDLFEGQFVIPNGISFLLPTNVFPKNGLKRLKAP